MVQGPTRRTALRGLAGAASAGVLARLAATGIPLALGGCATAPGAAAPTLPLVKPPRLRVGDTIGLFNASSPATPEQRDRGIASIESLGFRVQPAPHLMAAQGHLAGTVAQRVEDLHVLWRDPNVKALWSLRGGYGAYGLLPHLDYALMRRVPKALIGFSDVTALHLALAARAGLVSFHAPVATSTFTDETRAVVEAVLMEGRAPCVLERHAAHRERGAGGGPFAARTIRAGVAEGALFPANLSLLAGLIGTPYLPRLAGSVLALEDVGETPARLDRMLTQLDQAAGLARMAALVGGVFEKCEPPADAPSMTLAEVIDHHFAPAGVPAVYGWSFGHIRGQWVLPVGVRARVDPAAETLTLLEAAVA